MSYHNPFQNAASITAYLQQRIRILITAWHDSTLSCTFRWDSLRMARAKSSLFNKVAKVWSKVTYEVALPLITTEHVPKSRSMNLLRHKKWFNCCSYSISHPVTVVNGRHISLAKHLLFSTSTTASIPAFLTARQRKFRKKLFCFSVNLHATPLTPCH